MRQIQQTILLSNTQLVFYPRFQNLSAGCRICWTSDTRYLIISILIADKSWRAIVMTPQVEIRDDNSWNEFLTKGFISPDTIASSIKDKLIEKIDTSESPFKWLSVDMKYQKLFGKIRLNGSTPALISVLEYNRAFCDSDYELIEILCDAVAIEFQKNEYHLCTRGTQHEDLFVYILDGKLKYPSSITERLKALKLSLNKFLYVFVHDIFSSLANHIGFEYVLDDIEKMIIEGNALVYDGRGVIVAHFSAEDGIIKATTNLGLFLKKLGMRCGISRVFEQLTDLRLHYEQATNALNVGQYIEPEELIHFYSKYGIYHAAKVYSGLGWAESFIHAGLIAH